MKGDIREEIKEALGKSRYGMTIGEIAVAVSVHRYTVTKYVYELIGRGDIVCREVGKAKLCFLGEEKRNAKGEAGFVAALFFILLFVLLRSLYA